MIFLDRLTRDVDPMTKKNFFLLHFFVRVATRQLKSSAQIKNWGFETDFIRLFQETRCHFFPNQNSQHANKELLSDLQMGTADQPS